MGLKTLDQYDPHGSSGPSIAGQLGEDPPLISSRAVSAPPRCKRVRGTSELGHRSGRSVRAATDKLKRSAYTPWIVFAFRNPSDEGTGTIGAARLHFNLIAAPNRQLQSWGEKPALWLQCNMEPSSRLLRLKLGISQRGGEFSAGGRGRNVPRSGAAFGLG